MISKIPERRSRTKWSSWWSSAVLLRDVWRIARVQIEVFMRTVGPVPFRLSYLFIQAFYIPLEIHSSRRDASLGASHRIASHHYLVTFPCACVSIPPPWSCGKSSRSRTVGAVVPRLPAAPVALQVAMDGIQFVWKRFFSWFFSRTLVFLECLVSRVSCSRLPCPSPHRILTTGARFDSGLEDADKSPFKPS